MRVCGTTPCMLHAEPTLFKVCRERIHAEPLSQPTAIFVEGQCLGACVNAPMVLIWNDT